MNSYESDVIVLLSFLRACLLLVARWFTDGHAVAVITLDLFFSSRYGFLAFSRRHVLLDGRDRLL